MLLDLADLYPKNYKKLSSSSESKEEFDKNFLHQYVKIDQWNFNILKWFSQPSGKYLTKKEWSSSCFCKFWPNSENEKLDTPSIAPDVRIIHSEGYRKIWIQIRNSILSVTVLLNIKNVQKGKSRSPKNRNLYMYFRSIGPCCWGTCPTKKHGGECLPRKIPRAGMWTSFAHTAWHCHPSWIICPSKHFLGD